MPHWLYSYPERAPAGTSDTRYLLDGSPVPVTADDPDPAPAPRADED